jgi:hypothetical protein
MFDSNDLTKLDLTFDNVSAGAESIILTPGAKEM